MTATPTRDIVRRARQVTRARGAAVSALSSATGLAGLRRRVVGEQSGPTGTTSVIDSAPRWVSGVLAAVQAAVLSLLTVVVPAVAAFVATSADPVNADGGWSQAVGVGAGLWLLGHGLPLIAGGTSITLVPLGITALAAFACYVSARRSARTAVSSWSAGVGAYTTVVVLVTVAAGPAGLSPGRVVLVGLGAAGLAGVGLGAGMLARGDAPSLRQVTAPLWLRVPALVRTGAAAGVLALLLTVAVAGIVTGGWLVAGRERTGALLAELSGDVVSNVVLVVSQLAVLPNLAVWVVAWLAGPGFAVGAESLYSPSGTVPGPLPAVPMLGALPQGAGGLASWAPTAIVLAGMVAGWFAHRRSVPVRSWEPWAAVCCGAVVAGLGAAVLVSAASGSIGPGRMAHVGASAAAVGLVVFVEVAVGMALVAVPASAPVRAAVGRRARQGWARVGQRPVR